MPHILLTGFEPFDAEPLNPSAEVALALAGQVIAGWTVHSLVLPCVFDAVAAPLQQALDRWRPGVVMALGQAGGRHGISLERVAINFDDARIPDNAGAQPRDQPVCPGGAPAHFTRLPVKAIVQQLVEDGLPAEVSLSAGSFVCNHLFYRLMQALRRRPSVQAGFVHLPWLPEQAARQAAEAASLPLAGQIRAVQLALHTTLAWRGRGDLAAVGGRVS
jgi:pyroglutamyl-peptidase